MAEETRGGSSEPPLFVVPHPVALVTGATGGLGEALCLALARENWTLLVHGRDAERAAALAARLRAEGGDARAYVADFASLAEVRALADRLLAKEDRLDLLVNNAGLGIGTRHRAETSEDGHDLVMQVNYLAAWLLARRLRPLLAKGGQGAIVNIASTGQWPLDFGDFNMRRRWVGGIAYGRSKLALAAWTLGAAPDLAGDGIAIDAIHPATLMPTRMTAELAEVASQNFIGRLLSGRLKPRSTVEEGAANVLALVAAARAERVSGLYFDGAHEAVPHKQARDPAVQAELEAMTRELTGED